MANIVALIPARGGSKGIPNKNIMPLCGKPVLAWTIELTRKSKYISSVVVSTDSEQIANVARTYKAEVPFLRPANISGDLALDIETFEHYFNYLKAAELPLPDLVVHLRASSPVRDIEIIDQAIKIMLEDEHADALRSMSSPLQTPYKMWQKGSDGYANPLLTVSGNKDPQSGPRQVLPEVLWQNGYVDVVRPRAILEHHTMWGKKVIPFVVEKELFELDYPENIPDVENALQAMLRNEPQEEPGNKSKRHAV